MGSCIFNLQNYKFYDLYNRIDYLFYYDYLFFITLFHQVANQMDPGWAGPPAMMMLFKKFFGSHSCQSIPRQNNFTNFQKYYLQKVNSVCKTVKTVRKDTSINHIPYMFISCTFFSKFLELYKGGM